MLFLQQFTFQFEYRPGKSLGHADAMSRISSITSECPGILESISEAQLKDQQFSPVIKTLSDGTLLPSRVAPGLRQSFLHNGVLYHQFQKSSMSFTINSTTCGS